MDVPKVKVSTPVVGNERIQSLDVVRGFALIGVLMMNVEYFNRPIAQLGSGLQPGLSGASFWVSWSVQYFVTGKFWTIFALLFGMGFAVMLSRAEHAGRSFLVPYMRRIAALAIFGVLHSIFLWPGDILFAYAVGAVALLVVLYGKPAWIAAAIVLCIGCSFISGTKWMFGSAGALGFFSLAGWCLRGEQRMKRFGHPPVVAFVLMLLGAVGILAGIGMWIWPEAPREARFGLPTFGIVLFVLGCLAQRYHHDRAARPWRLGVAIYCSFYIIMTAAGAQLYFFLEKPAIALSKEAANQAANQTDERAAERAKNRKTRDEQIQKETKVITTGTYAETVALRTERFKEHAPNAVDFSTVLISIFLLGTWFVRAGVMENARAHLPLFRKLALFGLPIGIGLGLLGSTIAMRSIPGSGGADGWQLASGLHMLGNLPAALGYISVVILMLHSTTVFNKVRVLAPFGRMALTNYLSQSLIASLFFFGYGFGNWGVARIDQMLFVAVVVVFQIAFSQVWLSHFRYGPMEWLWRALTYWTIPPMRIKAAPQLANVDADSGPSATTARASHR